MGNIQLVLAVYVITFIIGFPSNILALAAFIKKLRRNPTPMYVLLLNLSISDLLFLIFLPFRMKEANDKMEWNMPYFLCPLSRYIFFTGIYNSILFLTAISVERYLGVAFPIQYKLKRKPRYAVIFSVVAWSASLANCSVIFIMQYFDHDNATAIDPSERRTCYREFSKAQLAILLPVRLEVCIVLFFIPLLICSFCYVNFIRLLSRMPNIRARKRYRAIALALGTMLVFLICFVPYNISHILGFAHSKSPSWRMISLLGSTLNACLDPCIYYFSSSALKNTCREIVSRVAKGLHCQSSDGSAPESALTCADTEEHTKAFKNVSGGGSNQC